MKQKIPFYGPFEATVQNWAKNDHYSLNTHSVASKFYSYIEKHQPDVSVVGVDEAVLEQRVIEKVANNKDRPAIIAVMSSMSEPVIVGSFN